MEQLKMSMDIAKLHRMFGPKMYASRYSFISEICQNAVDSHRMAKQKDPVQVGINRGTFYVRDTGLSFTDKEDFTNKILTLLESGKEEKKTDDEDCPMGNHGIGSMSVSAYNDTWRYRVVTPDKKLFYCTLKYTEDKGLMFELSDYTYDVDEEKSVLFEVGIRELEEDNYEYSDGKKQLIAQLHSKLSYFKDIEFKFDKETCEDLGSWDLEIINSKFQIFQADAFQVTTLEDRGEMHICLDQYYYPIRWDLLGIKPIAIDIALKFNMAEGLVSDSTRENLVHTSNYKELVMNKLSEACTWMVNKYNTTSKDEYEDIKEFIEDKNGIPSVDIGGVLNIILTNEILSYSRSFLKEVKFKGVSSESITKFLAGTNNGEYLYEPIQTITGSGKICRARRDQKMDDSEENFLLGTTPIKKTVMNYMRAEKRTSGIFTKKIIPFKGRGTDLSISRIMELCDRKKMKDTYKKVGVNPWRQPCEDFFTLFNACDASFFTHLEDVVVPADFVHRKKVVSINRREKIDLTAMTGEMGIGVARTSKSSSMYWSAFDDKTIKVTDLLTYNSKGLVIYGAPAQKAQLDICYGMLHFMRTAKAVTSTNVFLVSDKNKAIIEQLNLSNFMAAEEFLKGKHINFRKLMTAKRIKDELLDKYEVIVDNISIIKSHLSAKFADDLSTLNYYFDENGECFVTNFINSSDIVMECIKLAEEEDLYDDPINDMLDNILLDIEKFDFLEFFCNNGQSVATVRKDKSQNHPFKVMLDVAKHRSEALSWKHYKMELVK